MIVILLFNYYFGQCRPFVVCGCAISYVKRKPGVAFSVSEAPDAVSLAILTIKPVSHIFALKQTSCLPFNS